MLRRLSKNQPEEFKFTAVNLDWAKAQLKKYPKGRQASAVIPLLWKAQEQEGWISKPAIEFVAEFLDMPELVNSCLNNKFKVEHYICKENWIDVGRMETLEKAKNFI